MIYVKPVERIDLHLGEVEQLLHALIFMAENTEARQHELLQHTVVSLSWCAVDKIRDALVEIGKPTPF